MKDNFDQKIRDMAHNEKFILPTSYENKLNATLDLLKEPSKQKKWVFKYKLAASLAIIIIAGISASAVASVNEYNQRMQQMSQQEKDNMYEKIESSDALADTFIRELTDEEYKRLYELKKQYKNEGLFPKSEVLQITSRDQIQKDRICYNKETSTYYIPDRELTDEDLLQIIDLWAKQEYVIAEKTKDISDDQQQNVNENSNLTREEAEEKAAQAVQKIFNLDTSSFDRKGSFNSSTDDEGNVISQYMVTLSSKHSLTKYLVLVDGFTGDTSWIQLSDASNTNDEKSDFKENYPFDKEKAITKKALVDDLLKNILGESEKPSVIYLEYILNKDGNLPYGIASYRVILNDDRGYLFKYSFNMDRIFEVCYIENFKEYDKSRESIRQKREAEGMVYYSVPLE